MAIVSAINPAIGFFGSVVKWIASGAKKNVPTFILNLASSIIPTGSFVGDFIKDLSIGMVADTIEASSIGEAVDRSIPLNDIALNCDICGIYRRYYVNNENGIVCKDCYTKNLERTVQYDDKIYIFEKGIYKSKETIKRFNFSFKHNYKFDFDFNFEQ